MILDMHVHTVASDDSTATIAGYIDLILAYRRFHPFDGFILTEHRTYTPGLDLRKYWDEHGVLVLQGIEMDTNLGHLLVYGINDRVLERFDLSKRMHDGRRIIAELEDLGAIAVPSHPFRESVFGNIITRDVDEVAGVRILERYNGQNTAEQNARADTLCAQHTYRGLGGSDAHYVDPNWFLTCATAFEDSIGSMDDLVETLRYGHYQPVILPAVDAAHLPVPAPVVR